MCTIHSPHYSLVTREEQTMTSYRKPDRTLLFEAMIGMGNSLPESYNPPKGYLHHLHLHDHETDGNHQTGMDRRYPWSADPNGKPAHNHRHYHLPADEQVHPSDLNHHETRDPDER